MVRSVLYLVQKEFRQVFRDRTLLRVILIVPIVQIFVLGYAANTDLKNVRLSVLDQDSSRDSRSLADAYYASDVFIPGPRASSPAELQNLLLEGQTDVGLWIPRGYAATLLTSDAVAVSMTFNGQNSSAAGRSVGYASEIALQEVGRYLESAALAQPDLARRARRIESSSRFFYNPELRSQHYMVPGIVVLLITIISALLTGVAVVREREIGTLEQLMVSPLTPGQLIAGKTIPFALIAFFELTFATTVAVLWFRLPLEGSVLLLGVAAAIYLNVTLGVGLLASTVSSTQQQAMFTMWFFLVFGILMSGFFYPIENMPREVQWLTYLNPLRYMMSMVRGIFLRGSGVVDLAPDLARLAIIGVVTFAGAALRFQKRLG